MLNYPEMIKNNDTSTKLATMGYSLNKKGFITKGKELNDTEVCASKSDNTTITISKEELATKQKEQIDFLASNSKEVINQGLLLNNVSIALNAFMIGIAVLVKVPLFGVGFCYFGGTSLIDNIKLGKLKKQIESDKWFSDNSEKVNEELQPETKLYQKLTTSSKEILTSEGTITLNNIDEFPKDDLRLIRRSISRKIKQEEKAKQKVLTR